MQELTGLQRVFLHIVKSFVQGSTYSLPGEFDDLEQLYEMAKMHQMTAAVYEKIRRDPCCSREEYALLMCAWKREAMKEVMLQIQRTEGFLAVYEKLCNAGLKPLVVKGLVCRNLYEKPDYRISADEDLLLEREDFWICDRILRQEGFQRPEPDKQHMPDEIPYINRQNGVYIELHFALFEEGAAAYGHFNREFVQVFEKSTCMEISGKRIWTLCPTDHLFYLICHSLKHFMHSGFGIRQVCDMVLMAEHCGEEISRQELGKRLERLHMQEYWEALEQIGEKYLGLSGVRAFDPESRRGKETDCIALLQDLLEGGIYGDSSTDRCHSANITLAAAAEGRVDMKVSLKASLFPDKGYMKEHFPVLNKFPRLLIPVYMLRICRYIKNHRKGMPGQNSLRLGRKRMKLLRQYGMIK